MSKRKLLVSFMVLVLVFMGSFVLSGKKPSPYTWSATIVVEDVEVPTLNLYPRTKDYIYTDGVNGVNIQYETQIVNQKTKLEYTKVGISIDKTSTPEAHVYFQGIGVGENDIEVTPDGHAGGFPPCYYAYGFYPNQDTQTLSGCLNSFINDIDHPYTNDSGIGYQHILFMFTIGANLDELTIDFSPGVEYEPEVFGSATIYFWNNFESDDGKTLYYHTLTASMDNHISCLPVYAIARMDNNSWKIRIVPQAFTLEESYVVESTRQIGNSGKVQTIREYRHPLIASAEMSYAFTLKRAQ